MLDRMRNWGRTYAVKVLFGFLILAFAFWGVGTGLAMRVHPIATVNGNRILASELDRKVENMKQTLSQMYGSNVAQALRGMNLRQEALSQIIEERLIADESRHLGIRISDEALADHIAADPNFQVGGHFDPDRYQQLLEANQLMPSDYEASVRIEMVQDALRKMVFHGVQVSDAEARQAYDLRNEKLSLAYIEIPYQDFVAKVSPTARQIADYYKSHQDDFREPERIKIAYIHYDPMLLAAKITPSDKEIEDYYKSNLKTMYAHPDQVHARHILIEVQSGATQNEKAKAKTRAEDILKQLQHGADFTKLAKEDSQDPATASEGGDLGLFGRGQMIKPFEDAAFSMKPGELRLVETRFGYHIVKLEAFIPAHTDKLEDVKPKIIEALRGKEGGRIGRQALDEDVSTALSGASLDEIAKKRGIEVVQTPAFARDEAISIVHDPKLVDAAFKLEAGQVRAVPGSGGAPYLIKLISREPAHVPPLKEIEAKVREAYVRATAQAQARSRANDLREQIKSPNDFNKIAETNSLTVHKTDAFSRSSELVPGIGSFTEVTDAAAMVAKVPGVIDRVMQNKGDSYIFEVTARSDPSEQDWENASKNFTEEYTQQRRAQAFTNFIDELKSRAKITIDASQFGEVPASAPPQDTL